MSSKHWTETKGIITYSEIEEISKGTAMTGSESNYNHKINIGYSYSVSGEEYLGTKIIATLPNTFERKRDAEEILEKYPTGSKPTIYFNPNNPKESALIAGKQINSIAIVALGILAAAIVSGILWVLRSGLLGM